MLSDKSVNTTALDVLINLEPNLQTSHKILAIEADRVALFLLATQLEDMGYNVITANNGSEALEILKQTPDIEVVLLDSEIADISSMEMVMLMKSDTKLAKLQVIMQIGDGEQIKDSIDMGAYYCLTKPLQRNILKSVIHTAIHAND